MSDPRPSSYQRYAEHPGRGFVVEVRYLGARRPFHKTLCAAPEDAKDAFNRWKRSVAKASRWNYNIEVTLTALLKIDAHRNRRFVFDKGLPHALPDPGRR